MSSTAYYEMSSLDKHVRTPPSHTDTLASTLDLLSNPKYTNLPNLPLLNKNRRYFATKQRCATRHSCSFSVVHSLSPIFLSLPFLPLPSIYKPFISVLIFPENQLWSICQLTLPKDFTWSQCSNKDTMDSKLLWCHHISIIKKLIVYFFPLFVLQRFCIFVLYISICVGETFSDPRNRRFFFFFFNHVHHRNKNNFTGFCLLC